MTLYSYTYSHAQKPLPQNKPFINALTKGLAKIKIPYPLKFQDTVMLELSIKYSDAKHADFDFGNVQVLALNGAVIGKIDMSKCSLIGGIGRLQMNSYPVLDFTDLNFDGYYDLRIFNNAGAANDWYGTWLYESKLKKWIYNEDLSAASQLKISNKIEKKLVSHYHGGKDENLTTYYQWVNGNLVSKTAKEITQHQP